MGPRMRGFMPPRMQGGPGVGRGMVSGPRPLLPEMVSGDFCSSVGGYPWLLFNLQGPVVRKSVNANPRLKINQGVYVSIPKRC